MQTNHHKDENENHDEISDGEDANGSADDKRNRRSTHRC